MLISFVYYSRSKRLGMRPGSLALMMLCGYIPSLAVRILPMKSGTILCYRIVSLSSRYWHKRPSVYNPSKPTGDPATYGGVLFIFIILQKILNAPAGIFFKGLVSAHSNCTDVILYNIRTDTYSQLGKPTLYSFYTLSATPSFSEGVHLRQALATAYLNLRTASAQLLSSSVTILA